MDDLELVLVKGGGFGVVSMEGLWNLAEERLESLNYTCYN
jgi:hypothetical protein